MRLVVATNAVRMSARQRLTHEEMRSVDGSRLKLEETLKAVAIPPVSYAKCPRVEHFLAGFTGRASDVISVALQLPMPFVEELFRFGAVHSCPVIPDTSPSAASLTPETQVELKLLREEAERRVGRHPSCRRPKRVQSDELLHQHAYCRVHVHPKRFPAFYRHDWHQRVIFQNQHCIVVNKPPGCQVPPRVDNRLECLVTWMQRFCEGEEVELRPVHRLDTGTEGLVVLAKTVEFARFYQQLLKGESGSVEKTYRALTPGLPPLGTWRHYIKDNHCVSGQPRRSLVYCDPTPGASYAELEILSAESVTLHPAAQQEWQREEAYEVEVALKTGRTHQIRVQLAHEGFPLLGDGLYDPMSLEATPKSLDGRIGLQAARLRLQGEDLGSYFEHAADNFLAWDAGEPWWRARESIADDIS